MRLWLVSHLVDSPGNRLALAAAARLGHEARLVDPGELGLRLGPARLELTDARGALTLPDVVYTRLGGAAPAGAFAPVQQLEGAGVRCVNRATPLVLARDKLSQLQLLAQAGLSLPETVIRAPGQRLEDLVAPLGPPPWVFKLALSTQGQGVFRVPGLPELEERLGQFAGERVLLQRLVPEAAGRDLRLLVVGGEVVAAMRRQAADPEEFRSNLHQGGRATAAPLETLPRAVLELAVAAAAALDLELAGVDLLEGARGPLICEVNASPGLEGLSRACGRDLAEDVVGYLALNPLA